MRRPADQIERLRSWRAPPEIDTSIGQVVADVAANARRHGQRLGALVDLWEELVPSVLVGRTRITALRGGTLHVAADSASTAYELDRLLRGGLEQALRRRYAATLTRVKVTVGPPESVPLSARTAEPNRPAGCSSIAGEPRCRSSR